MYAKFHQNIPYHSRDMASFTFSEIGPPMTDGIGPPMTTADLSTVYLSYYSFAYANCLPVYRRPANLCSLTTCLLPTSLPPICTPLSLICQEPTCQPSLSTVYLSSYSFPSANCLPVYRRPVHLCPLTTCLLPTCLPSICPPMSTEYLPTADLSTADLSTYVHLYEVWFRTLVYCASLQENCLGTILQILLLIFGNFSSFP